MIASKAMAQAEVDGVETVQLRHEKNTKPRMWFIGPAPQHVEEDIPQEGESYSGDAYSIFNWKKRNDAQEG